MPKLIIDGIEIDVLEGTNVLEAAKKVGITIPHFCYHPALGSVGACRLCAMKFLEGPVKGVQVSCMIKAADGMVVSTTDGEAARLRRMVIEWLMVNHPHDCPVCDEGGMCLLQDYTVAGGHSIRRYRGKKRTYQSQYLGGFIAQEMNRCIQCYRCTRFYNEYAGGDDFGPMGIASKVFFGRHEEGWLQSVFSGNLADVCPTGVFTDKTYRFKSRLWDLERAPSICPHCSLGCNVIAGGRYREFLRVEARENPDVNGWFICDRGRFGYGFANHPERPRKPKADGDAMGFDGALDEVTDILSETIAAHGTHSVSFMGSPRASLETNYVLKTVADVFGSQNVCYSPDPARERKDRLAASRMKPGLARSLRGVEFSDFIIAAGIDPVNEAPMLALMMRQAARRGSRVIVIDPRPVEMPLEFTHIPCAPAGLADILAEVLKSEIGCAKSPTIIVGMDVGDGALIDAAYGEAARFRDAGLDAGLMFVMDGPNSYGNALLAGDGPDFEVILEGIERGRIKTLVVAESDPLGRYPDSGRVCEAFGLLDALIVMDYLPTETVRAARVVLPSTACAEGDGVFVNNEGRAQVFAKAYSAGIPVNAMGPGLHPPREFHAEVPGAAMPAWLMLREVACRMRPDCLPFSTAAGVRHYMAGEDPMWGVLTTLDPESGGAVLPAETGYNPPEPPVEFELAASGLTLVAACQTFGTEEISSYSDKLNPVSPEPYVIIQTGDAAGLGITAGTRVLVTCGETSFACGLRVSDKMASGVAVAPRLPGLPVAWMAGKTVKIVPA
ncbi:MAG: NADH-quinone oxidoreductase subunit NuoG [Nitrospirae bacterium]|nr:NADH-quinone oxidoreductase subunit NuoG [Nitrospirota bacterium]